MGDDLANGWGCTLVHLSRTQRKRKEADERINDQVQRDAFFRSTGIDLDGAFRAVKAMPSGSDANLYAITCLTKGSNEGCLIAAGAYVAGDMSPLRSWSSTKMLKDYGVCMIMHPNQYGLTDFTRRQTIPLPYHIPDVMNDLALFEYEKECMENLHCRCLVQAMKGVPITALLMEITLAGNGATLSDRALTMLGRLANMHGFGIIVDEIMTGGRTGTMLLSMQKPQEFIDSISFITMGKWVTCGLVLASKKEADIIEQENHCFVYRGSSTNLCCVEAYATWKAVKDMIPNTGWRRHQVLQKLKVAEEDAWGQGLHIFVPIRRDSWAQGLKNRYLPLLEDVPIQNFRKTYLRKSWSKEAIHEELFLGNRKWLEPVYIRTQEEGDYHKLVKGLFLVHDLNNSGWFSTEYCHANILDGSPNARHVTNILRVAERAGLIVRKQNGAREERVRGWKVTDFTTSALKWIQEMAPDDPKD